MSKVKKVSILLVTVLLLAGALIFTHLSEAEAKDKPRLTIKEITQEEFEAMDLSNYIRVDYPIHYAEEYAPTPTDAPNE